MQTQQITPRVTFIQLLENNTPQAIAWVTGSPEYPQISGLAKFYDTPYGGTLIESEFFGLPNISVQNSTTYYAMHIHEFGNCSDSFQHIGEHYNPSAQPHPFHAGDLLPLLSNQGYAWSSFYDKRFQVKDIIGRSVVIHAQADDFTSQPAGNSGIKIGCGVIRVV